MQWKHTKYSIWCGTLRVQIARRGWPYQTILIETPFFRAIAVTAALPTLAGSLAVFDGYAAA